MAKTIVLIDDNSADNVLHEKIIRNTDSQADIAIIDNGDEAITYLSRELSDTQESPDKIIIIDEHMPGISGLDVLEELEDRVDIDPSRVEIYFLTNDHSKRLEEKVFTFNGVKKIIRKPLTPEAAAEIMRNNDEDAIAERRPSP